MDNMELDQTFMEYRSQISDIIEDMINRNDIKTLDETLRNLQPLDDLENLEAVYAACAVLFFHKESYDDLVRIILSVTFHPRWHSKLQYLWNEMNYKIAVRIKGKPIGPVSKYRIRRKYPFPRTIWDGVKISRNIKDSSRKTLNEFYKLCEYPTPHQKQELSECTGLSITQIINWFKNRRARSRNIRKKMEVKEQKQEEKKNREQAMLEIQQLATVKNFTEEQNEVFPLYALELSLSLCTTPLLPE